MTVDVVDAPARRLDVDLVHEVALGSTVVVVGLEHLQLAQTTRKREEGQRNEDDRGLEPRPQVPQIVLLVQADHRGAPSGEGPSCAGGS